MIGIKYSPSHLRPPTVWDYLPRTTLSLAVQEQKSFGMALCNYKQADKHLDGSDDYSVL